MKYYDIMMNLDIIIKYVVLVRQTQYSTTFQRCSRGQRSNTETLHTTAASQQLATDITIAGHQHLEDAPIERDHVKDTALEQSHYVTTQIKKEHLYNVNKKREYLNKTNTIYENMGRPDIGALQSSTNNEIVTRYADDVDGDVTVCLECCTDNYCNINGCGSPGNVRFVFSYLLTTTATINMK